MAEGSGAGSPIVVPDDVDICNRALSLIGWQTFIEALTDTDAEGVACNLFYSACRDELLRMHPWRFASFWVCLVQDAADDSGTSDEDDDHENDSTTLYDMGRSGEDDEWTPDAYIDKYLYITAGTGANQVRLISDNDETSLTVSVAFNTTPDETSTYEIWTRYPPYPWEYQYALPSDYLRLNATNPDILNDNTRFEIDAGVLKTNETALWLNYVRQETTETNFDPLFADALAARLATRLCMPLMRDKVLLDRLEMRAAETRKAAGIVSRGESKPDTAPQTWSQARYGWARNPNR